MNPKRLNSAWKAFALAVVFAITVLVCCNVCHDSDDWHGGDETAECGCLCGNSVLLQLEQTVFARNVPGDTVACEAPVGSTLLTSDIFRPPIR